MSQELILTAPRRLALQDYQERPLQENEVRAEAILSGISHGTEMALYRGTSPFDQQRFDPELRLFVPADKLSYPMHLGYEWVGRVTEVGSAVQGFHPGDLVHLPRGHRRTQTFVAGAESGLGVIEPLPPGIDPEQGVLLALAGVALQAIHDARIKIGDQVAVFGLGAVGLLAMQLARLNGAAWVGGSDPLPARRRLAESFGADRVFDPQAVDVGWEIKSADARRGVDIAIEASGHTAGLHQAIRSVRMGGLVVAAGYYQGGSPELRLGEEWLHNRVSMVASMGVWGCPHRDYPGWDRGRVHAAATKLVAQGRLRTEGLITHRFPFEQAAQAYSQLDEQDGMMVKVVFTY